MSADIAEAETARFAEEWEFKHMSARAPFFCSLLVLASLAPWASANDHERERGINTDSDTPHRKLEESLVIGSALVDIATTEYFLRQNPALAEGNPLAQSTAARIGIKAGAAVGLIMLARHYDGNGAHKTARVIRWTTISVWSGAAGWNLHLGLTVPVGGE